MSRKKRTNRVGVEMTSCGLRIPKTTLQEVTFYAEYRKISRNAAFEELVKIALFGPDSITTTREQIDRAIKEAAAKMKLETDKNL